MGGSKGEDLRVLRGSCGVPQDPYSVPWASLGCLGDFFAVPWDALGVPWQPLGHQMDENRRFGGMGRSKGKDLRALRVYCGGPMGSFQSPLGPCGVHWGGLCGALGSSWGPLATLGAPNGKIVEKHNENQRF